MSPDLEIFPWNESFDCGLSPIDQQHRVLVDLVNALARHMTEPSGVALENGVFDRLEEYAAQHFRVEEAIWEQHIKDDILIEEHGKKHRDFVAQVARLRKMLGETGRAEAVRATLLFLSRWLAYHILESDVSMAETVKAIQSGATQDEALRRGKLLMKNEAREALVTSVLSLCETVSDRTIQLMQETGGRSRAESSLQKTEKQYKAIFETSRDAFFVLSPPDWRITSGNFSAMSMFKIGDEAELVSLTLLRLSPETQPDGQSSHEKLKHRMDKALQDGKVFFDWNCKRLDGQEFPANVILTAFEWDDKSILQAIIRDITELKKSRDQVKLATQFFAVAQEGIILSDSKNNILDVNPTFCEITGYGRQEVIGRNPRFLSSGKHDQKFYVDMWNSIRGEGHWKGEIWNRRKNGELYVQNLNISCLRDSSGDIQYYLGLFTDITQAKMREEESETAALFDPLTKLPNQALFADRFSRAIARNRRDKTILAICSIDLDKFKPINDAHGHEVGDKVLMEVAQRIKASIREEDTVARMDEDKFALLLGDLKNHDQCELVLERTQNSIRKPYEVDGKTFHISASIGVTLHPLDDAATETLWGHADHAMYQAKQYGRNRYHFHPAAQ